MNPDQTKTKKALKNLDWLALRQELEAVDLTDKNLQIVLMMVLRSDSMVRRRPGNDGATRDHLLMELESYLQEKGLEEAASIVSELQNLSLHRQGLCRDLRPRGEAAVLQSLAGKKSQCDSLVSHGRRQAAASRSATRN
jgi:hypothetical protein